MRGSIILLFGAPATGKSSLAREILFLHRAVGGSSRLIYLGTDSLRETLTGRDYVASLRPTVYRGLRVMAESAVLRGHHVLLDGNYLEEKLRRPIVNLAQRLGVRLLRVLTQCDLERSLRRNAGRTPSERVPEEVVRLAHRRQELARGDADRVVDTQTSDSRAAQSIVEWLVGAPLTQSESAPETNQEWRQAGEIRVLQPGERLWAAGQPSLGVALLEEGELEVVHEEAGAPDVVLARLNPPDLLGELSTLDGVPHSATVRACTVSRVRQIAVADFRHLLGRHPSMVEQVLRGMGARIRSLSQTAGAASVDPLTGLGNRRLYEVVYPVLVQQALKRGRPLSLGLFDVDRFKGINDGFGHEVGDRVLRCLGNTLKEMLPPPTVNIRLGGDEFVSLFPDRDGPAAAELLKDVADRLRCKPLELGDGVTLQPTLSVGVACLPVSSDRPEELLRLADEAAYHSKRTGRDRITLWPLP